MILTIDDEGESLGVRIDCIPNDLRVLPQWVTWRFEVRNGKRTKVPHSTNGTRASVTDSSTWTTFEAAIQAYRNEGFDGVGFTFTTGAGIVGIDLDKCRDPETGVIAPWATAIVERFQSYAEISPSGTGVHVLIRGQLIGKRRRKGPIEMYADARFFCVTGEHVTGTPPTIEERQAALDALYTEAFGADSSDDNAALAVAISSSKLDDDALIERARTASNGAKFAKLWAGDTTGFGSQSEADLALCSILARHCGAIADRIDRLFRRSGLYREKWDRPDYRKATIDKAIGPGIDDPMSNVIPRGNYLTELWAAEKLVETHGKDLRWCPTLGWMAWDETRWRRDETGEVYRRAKKTIRRLYAEAAKLNDDKDREKMVEFAKGCERNARLNAIVELARTQPGVPVTTDKLDADPWLFNCFNGTINLQTGEFCEHRREDFITKLAPVTFDPKAECRLWRKCLDDIFAGDAAMIRFVQRALGHALTGVVREDVLHVLYGTGANGKTTLIEAILGLMGDYAMPAAPGLLLARRNDQHPTERADLWGKRFVASVEVGEGRSFNEELVKQLTGRDSIKGRFMHKDFFTFPPTHKLFLAANHKPEIRGTDYAIWRRIKLWPFNVTFHDPSEGVAPVKDVALPERLIAERPGILRWCVEGCLAWNRESLVAPEAVSIATQGYRDESDRIGEFLESRCRTSEGSVVGATELYLAYKIWAEANGESVLNQKRFGGSMVDRGFSAKPHGSERRKHYFGVELMSLG